MVVRVVRDAGVRVSAHRVHEVHRSPSGDELRQPGEVAALRRGVDLPSRLWETQRGDGEVWWGRCGGG